ncbi:2-dehydro-3-deoxygluconokinase [Sphingobium sp. B2D3A]|uniref:sugar kinase n=1 Tax=unclassified Sphingobium TaxID=2611147 RepID=UPI002224BA56|nr:MULTISPECIES: sugar kinase [unclassified Sphingobium]MCW2337452.1 2-dehydro-3-deoxygluconokinase [Sphingobium sp. B2D3A]MCW2383910.1 2-dehydro-3-deoxygluconokinase [Sphingobium sp. B2D3D]
MTPGPILCFGELLLRLSAVPGESLFQSERLDARFVGAEANVAVALARLGVPSAFLTALPPGPVGDAALDALRRPGVDVRHLQRAPGRMGLFYLMPGSGLRAPAISYDRAGSSFAITPAERCDWAAALEGVAMLHLSGIIPALAPEAHKLSFAAMAAAKAAGIPISFDGNFRATLWESWCDNPAPILARHVEMADLFFGSARDIAMLLGQSFDAQDVDRRRAAAEAAFARFPNLRHIASTHRVVTHAGLHHLCARLDTPDDSFETQVVEVAGIVDRIGTGDAFAAGVIAHIDAGIATAAERGLALCVLNHFVHGDFSPISAEELAAFHPGQTGDVRR